MLSLLKELFARAPTVAATTEELAPVSPQTLEGVDGGYAFALVVAPRFGYSSLNPQPLPPKVSYRLLQMR